MKAGEIISNAGTIVVVLCTVAVSGLTIQRQFFPQQRPPSTPPSESTPVNSVGALARTGHLIGPRRASVIVVEFADFECPACRGFFTQTEALRRKYPQDFAIAFHHYPLAYHRFALPSARAAECAAEQGRFTEMYEALYRSQDSLGLLPFPELARRAGVPDSVKYEACLARTAKPAIIDADRYLGDSLGVRGTPGVIFAGRLYIGPPPIRALDSALRVAADRRTHRGA